MFFGPKGWLFVMFGILGIFGEVIFTSIGSLISKRSWRLQGTSYLWMFPIYGSIAFLFDPVNQLIAGWPWTARGCAYMVVIFLVEYICGTVLKKVTGEHIWHYTGRFNLHGQIQLTYAPVWFCVGLLIERFYDDLVELSLWLAMHFG